MKTNFFITMAILLSMIFSSFVHAQTVRDGRYEEYMQLALNRLDSAKTVEGLLQARNLFDRISKNYASEWLPAYYVAYCDVNSVFYDLKSSRNEMILEKASKAIEDMYAFPNAVQSEINTLKGYCLMAMIAMNPQVNGQQYFSEVIRLYETAMEQNPENPRPVILLADFEQRLPPFIQSDKRNPDEERTKATLLFEKENPNIEKPYWGKFFLR